MSLQYWPNEQLETVSCCPVCASKNNRVLESDLIDQMVDPPTGLWEMRVCGDCGVAYLSPRPGSEFINAAYNHYHTHTSDKDDVVHSLLRLIKEFFSQKSSSVASKAVGCSDYVITVLIPLCVLFFLYFDLPLESR